MYRALAKNCDAAISEKGAQAKDWKNGKPVRVVRNCKERKISKYAPEEGNRYDGIYKVRISIISDIYSVIICVLIVRLWNIGQRQELLDSEYGNFG